ncbi:hypothetical protein GQ600_17412 [Phytophthora cactorum]|nr:hypothetical protein GQ600_17412 [Phytophthora cactorum]
MSLNPKIEEMLQKNTLVDDAFIALEVDKATGNLLESQQWKDWAVFVIKRNKKDPDESLASALSVKFGLDGASKILATAAKDPKTKEIATKLEEVQLKHDVYKTVLKLESTSSPNADIWRAYYNAYDTAFPGKLFSFNPN